MLQARTEEQVRHIASVLGVDFNTTSIAKYPVSIIVLGEDQPISFDQMSEIVSYLRNEDGKRRGKAIRAAIKSKIDKLWVSGDTIFLHGANAEKVEAFILSIAEYGYDTQELLNEYKETGKITI